MQATERPRRQSAGALGLRRAAEQQARRDEEAQQRTAERAAEALEKLKRRQEQAAAREAKQQQLAEKARARAEQQAEAKRLAQEQQQAKAAEKEARRLQKERERALLEEAQEEERLLLEAMARDASMPASAISPGRTSATDKVIELLREVCLALQPALPCIAICTSLLTYVSEQAVRTVAENEPELDVAALEPLLAEEPSSVHRAFAASCMNLLNEGYAEGKKFPKSQLAEAEAVAACCVGGPGALRELKLAFCELHSGPPPAPPPPAGWGAAVLAMWDEVLRIFCDLNQPAEANTLKPSKPLQKSIKRNEVSVYTLLHTVTLSIHHSVPGVSGDFQPQSSFPRRSSCSKSASSLHMTAIAGPTFILEKPVLSTCSALRNQNARRWPCCFARCSSLAWNSRKVCHFTGTAAGPSDNGAAIAASQSAPKWAGI